MMKQLDEKYKNTGKELVWQWFFPAKASALTPNFFVDNCSAQCGI